MLPEFPIDTRKGEYVCPHCNVGFATKGKRNAHCKSMKTCIRYRDVRFVCTKCPFVAKGLRNMDRHLEEGCTLDQNLSGCEPCEEGGVLQTLSARITAMAAEATQTQTELNQLERTLVQTDLLRRRDFQSQTNQIHTLERNAQIICLEKENLYLKHRRSIRVRVRMPPKKKKDIQTQATTRDVGVGTSDTHPETAERIQTLQTQVQSLHTLSEKLLAENALKSAEVDEKNFTLLEMQGKLEIVQSEYEQYKTKTEAELTGLRNQLRYMEHGLKSSVPTSTASVQIQTLEAGDWAVVHQSKEGNTLAEGCDLIIRHLIDLKKTAGEQTVVPEEPYFHLEHLQFQPIQAEHLTTLLDSTLTSTPGSNLVGTDPEVIAACNRSGAGSARASLANRPIEAIPWSIAKCHELYQQRTQSLDAIAVKYGQLLETMLQSNIYQNQLKIFVNFRASSMCKLPFKNYLKMLGEQVRSMETFLVQVKKCDPSRVEDVMRKFLSPLDLQLLQFGDYRKIRLDPIYIEHLEQSCRVQSSQRRYDKLCYDNLISSMDTYYLATASLETILRLYLGKHSPAQRTVIYLPLKKGQPRERHKNPRGGNSDVFSFYELGGTNKGIRYWTLLNRLVPFASCLKMLLSAVFARLFRHLCGNEQVNYTPGFFQKDELHQTACKQLAQNCLHLYNPPQLLQTLQTILMEVPFTPTADQDVFDTFQDSSGGKLEYQRWMDVVLQEEQKEGLTALFHTISETEMEGCLVELRR